MLELQVVPLRLSGSVGLVVQPLLVYGLRCCSGSSILHFASSLCCSVDLFLSLLHVYLQRARLQCILPLQLSQDQQWAFYLPWWHFVLFYGPSGYVWWQKCLKLSQPRIRFCRSFCHSLCTVTCTYRSEVWAHALGYTCSVTTYEKPSLLNQDHRGLNLVYINFCQSC